MNMAIIITCLLCFIRIEPSNSEMVILDHVLESGLQFMKSLADANYTSIVIFFTQTNPNDLDLDKMRNIFSWSKKEVQFKISIVYFR